MHGIRNITITAYITEKLKTLHHKTCSHLQTCFYIVDVPGSMGEQG